MRIGIPVSFKHKGSQYYINQAYVEYVKNAGHDPVLLVPGAPASYDALLLPGGIDIDPMAYGEENLASQNISPAMDDFWRSQLSTANLLSLPVFGICRGFQLISWMLLSTDKRSADRFEYSQRMQVGHPQSEHRDVPCHMVVCMSAERFPKKPVNSMHHQALLSAERVNPDLTSLESAVINGIGVEYLSFSGAPKKMAIVESAYFVTKTNIMYGVQWHPEELNDYDLLNRYLEVHSASIQRVTNQNDNQSNVTGEQSSDNSLTQTESGDND